MRLGLSRREAQHAPIGHVLDLIACHAIANGANQRSAGIDEYESAMMVR